MDAFDGAAPDGDLIHLSEIFFHGGLRCGVLKCSPSSILSLNLSSMKSLRRALELGHFLTILFILPDFTSLTNSINTLLNVGSRAFLFASAFRSPFYSKKD
jgi:hypothetical protein